MKNTGGITFADYYPYNISAPTCNTKKNDFTVTVTNSYRIVEEQAMIDHVLAKGTLSVCVDATKWNDYRSGIFTDCGTGSALNINHAVNIVGVNVDEGYWIIRNSWGTGWGENGYMKLALVRHSRIVVSTACINAVSRCAVSTRNSHI